MIENFCNQYRTQCNFYAISEKTVSLFSSPLKNVVPVTLKALNIFLKSCSAGQVPCPLNFYKKRLKCVTVGVVVIATAVGAEGYRYDSLTG